MALPLARHALALDFGRVLTLDPNRSPFLPLLTQAGLETDAFFDAYSRERKAYDSGAIEARVYWAKVLNACRPGIRDQEVEFYSGPLIEADFLSWAHPRTGLHRLLQQALEARVPLAIVSNMPRGLGDRFVRTWPWMRAIPFRFFSGDFGLIKPDASFYRYVLERTGWQADQVLFVDDLAENIEKAREMGFETCLFTGSDENLATIARWCGLDRVRRT